MKNFTKIFGIFTMTIVSLNLFATEIRPDPLKPNSISDAIKSAVDGDVIILKRGAYYYHENTIEIAVSLTIKADDANAELPKPIIASLIKSDGSVDNTEFIVKADIVCENIHFHSGISGNPLHDDINICMAWSATQNMRAEFRGCIFQEFDASSLRLEAPDIEFFAYDCLWLNDHKTQGPSEGRAIDCRQYGPDSLIIQNSTLVNCSNRWIRHMPSSGKIDPINYAVIDHCTFVNCAGYHPSFDLGTIEKLQFTNNLVQNAGIMGTDFTIRASKVGGRGEIALPENYYSTTSSLRPFRLEEVFYDREDGIVVFACHGVDSIGTEITMHNNNIYNIPEIAEKLAENDTVSPAPIFCSQFEKSIVDVSSAYTEEAIDFVSGDDLIGDGFNYLDSIMDAYFGYWDKNQFFVMPYPNPEDLDLSYGKSAAAYKAAKNGYPLGDLNWYPELKIRWENGDVLTSVTKDLENNLKVSVYPNPATDFVKFSLDGDSPVSFKLYTVTGKQVYSSQEKSNFTLHVHKARIEKGIYIYNIIDNHRKYSGKLVVN